MPTLLINNNANSVAQLSSKSDRFKPKPKRMKLRKTKIVKKGMGILESDKYIHMQWNLYWIFHRHWCITQHFSERNKENVKGKNKIENDMYLKDQMKSNPSTLKPIENYKAVEKTDSKDDALLKQVREFLYQNMVSFI